MGIEAIYLKVQRALDAFAPFGATTEAHAHLAVEHERAHAQGPDVPPPLLPLIDFLRKPPLILPSQTVEEIIGTHLQPEPLPQNLFGFGPPSQVPRDSGVGVPLFVRFGIVGLVHVLMPHVGGREGLLVGMEDGKALPILLQSPKIHFFLSIRPSGILTGSASMEQTMEAVYHTVAVLSNRKQEAI